MRRQETQANLANQADDECALGKPVKRHYDLPCAMATMAMVLMTFWASWSFWHDVLQPAREAARRTQCKNNLVLRADAVHLPPSDYVTINVLSAVEEVTSDPWLCALDERITYHTVRDGDHGLSHHQVDEGDLDFQTVVDARIRLCRLKATQSWKEGHRTFWRRNQEISRIW